MAKDIPLPFSAEGGEQSRAKGAEYQNWENKQSLMERREIIRSIAAFATAKGGIVNVGISPKGERKGIQIGKNTVEQLANEIKANTEPPQYPSIEIEGEEHDAVLFIKCEESPIKPVSAHGVPVKRVGRTNQELKLNEVQRLIEETTNRTWDAVPFPEFAAFDASRQALDDYCARLGQPVGADAAQLWQSLGLLQRGEAIRAAVLLFAATPTHYFPCAQVKCARFLGRDSVDFLDEKTFEGPIISQLFDALAFIKRNTREQLRITGDPQHERIPEYPEEAIRETLTNAVVHRDYSSTATVQVRIYDDCLEVWNPGLLPDALTIADLYRKHASYPRNSRLVQLFNRAHLIEHYGTGTLRIVSSCVAAGMALPEFAQESGMFVVRFGNAARETAPQTSVGGNEGRILRIARQRGRVQTRDVMEILQVSRSTAVRVIQSLVDAQVLHRVGESGPNVYYTPYLDVSDDVSQCAI